ncbi:MAG: SDR family oxidoreductase [Planctomycetota bacterium]
MGSLAGKTALVSGACRGIGLGAAIELAREGAHVVINDLPDHPESAAAIAACQEAARKAESGGRAEYFAADVTDRQRVADLIQHVTQTHGGLDILVSNAAYSDRHLMIEQAWAEFDRTIQVSLMGAYNLVRTAAEAMVGRRRGGNIVVISSPHAHMPIPGAMAYNIAKAGCDQLAKTAACELAGHNIRVNLIHPGWIDTPGERKFFSEETLDAEGQKIPIGRLGKPADIGRGIVFLCGSESEYITGSTLTIDGGIQLPFREMYRIQEAKSAQGK